MRGKPEPRPSKTTQNRPQPSRQAAPTRPVIGRPTIQRGRLRPIASSRAIFSNCSACISLSGSTGATATTALTSKGETQQVNFAANIQLVAGNSIIPASNSTTAVSIALVIHGSAFFPVIVAGFYHLWRSGISFGSLCVTLLRNRNGLLC